MSELRELYQEVILDHGRHPRNFAFPEPSNRSADGHNPLCGDRITLKVRLGEDGRIEDIGFQGSGCAISTASASTMTEAVKGKTLAEAKALFQKFHDLVTGHVDPMDADLEALDKLAVFQGVATYPMRVKCATLPWHTLQVALDEGEGQVSTE
ncbi:MAG: Fe-S cluster assembly sulfur transfer protein SufU [Myxococcota bacterium]